MFKRSIAATILGLLFFSTAFAQTDNSTGQDLLAVIKQLQAQIQSLQAQVVDLQTQVQSVKIELKFNRALTQGTTGDDVKQLQEFLKNFTGAYPDGLISGYYGPLTAAAVKKFQAQNGIESVGIVGPKTQEKLNVLAAAIPATSATPVAQPTSAQQMSAAQTSTAPATPVIAYSGTETQTSPTTVSDSSAQAIPCKTPIGVQIPFSPTVIKILSPNGGEQWQIGGTYTIKYSAKDIAGNKALLIYLNKGYDAPTTKTGVNSSQLVGVTTNLESYTYTVPNNIQAWPGLGNNYTMSVYVEGSYSSCDATSYIGDSSDAEFSIVAGQGNAPSVPSSGPTTPGGTTTTMPGGGGYGAALTPDKILSQIKALQEKLNSTTTDVATRDSLKYQIATLTAQLQTISPNTPIPVFKPAAPPPQNEIQILYAQHSALTNQFNSTTDPATRNALWAQQAAVSEQIQALTPPEPTTQKRISELLEEINAHQGKLNRSNPAASDWGWLTSRIAELKAQIKTLESNPTTPAVQLLFSQIIALQNQLNSTTDATTRNSLVSQIVALKARMTSESGVIMPPTTQPTLSTPSVSTTPAPTSPAMPTSATVPVPAISTSATQDQITALLNQINALGNQWNTTTDAATQAAIMAQIAALKTQVQKLQSN